MRRSVVSRGHTISYRVGGAGAPLLLLCGWSRWADTWWDAGYVDGWGEGYRTIAVDRLGHGESDKPHDPAEYIEPSIVADMVAVLDAEQVDSALVWGYSLGARNAASLAQLQPTRVAALVLGGRVPKPSSPDDRQGVLIFAEGLKTDEGMTTFLHNIGCSEEEVTESLDRNDSDALSACVAAMVDWSPVPELIDAPSLWYVGSDDDGGFSTEELELAGRLGVELAVIPDADHFATFQRAEDVLPIVEPFLAQHMS